MNPITKSKTVLNEARLREIAEQLRREQPLPYSSGQSTPNEMTAAEIEDALAQHFAALDAETNQDKETTWYNESVQDEEAARNQEAALDNVAAEYFFPTYEDAQYYASEFAKHGIANPFLTGNGGGSYFTPSESSAFFFFAQEAAAEKFNFNHAKKYSDWTNYFDKLPVDVQKVLINKIVAAVNGLPDTYTAYNLNTDAGHLRYDEHNAIDHASNFLKRYSAHDRLNGKNSSRVTHVFQSRMNNSNNQGNSSGNNAQQGEGSIAKSPSLTKKRDNF